MSKRYEVGFVDPKGIVINKPGVGGLLAEGITVPADASTGYSPGCLFIDSNASAGAQVYINEGTAASADFNVIQTGASGSTFIDDALLGLGTGNTARFSWDTTDANANALLLQLPAGGSVDVPVLIIGELIESFDFGLYNGVVSPRVAIFGTGATATGPVIEFRKSRGTVASPTVVTAADDLGTINFYTCVAAGEYVLGASIRADAAATQATTRGPASISFLTATDAAPSVLTEAMLIDKAQTVTVNAGFVNKSVSAAAITTTRVLTAADSGGVFSVAKTSAYAITLPTPAQGLKFKFMVLDTGANIVTISSGGAHLNGIVSVNSVNTVMTGTTISLAATGALGDWVEFEGIDATHYLVTGACLNAADITVA